ncbi:DUF2934 domain-containing protein [Azospirillum canadense]|uniref:DUF2934 domain-containing protein n=1 Tax=Azospirillum canadense TaxID=403962 RepID=UPI0022261BFA|nr:DUF2934 domain-containing protein [Azospirillum canadense]MCW2239535.1 hypothetical protein [Azospirillum canadense]
MTEDRDARIRERAHSLWERDGRPEGMAEVHWIQARREIEAEEQAADAAQTAPVAKRRRKAATPAPAAAPPDKPRRSRKTKTSENTLTDAARQMGRMVAETVSDAVAAGVETVSDAVEAIAQPNKKTRRTTAAATKTDTPAKGRKAAWSPTDVAKAAASPAKGEPAAKRKTAAATGATKENGTSSPVTPTATARRATGKRRSSASVH